MVGVAHESHQNLYVLYLQSNPTQLFSFYLLHGLREVLHPENVVDVPSYEGRYEWDPQRPAGAVHQQDLHSHYMSTRWRLQHVNVDRHVETIRSKLKAGAFNLVVFGTLPEDMDGESLAGEVFRLVPKEQIIAVDTYDHMSVNMMWWARRVGSFFKLNLKDKCLP